MHWSAVGGGHRTTYFKARSGATQQLMQGHLSEAWWRTINKKKAFMDLLNELLQCILGHIRSIQGQIDRPTQPELPCSVPIIWSRHISMKRFPLDVGILYLDFHWAAVFIDSFTYELNDLIIILYIGFVLAYLTYCAPKLLTLLLTLSTITINIKKTCNFPWGDCRKCSCFRY